MSEDARQPLVARRKDDQNHAAVDPWTAVHMAVGLAAGLVNMPFWPSMAAAVAYEVFERQIEATDAGQRFFVTSGPETRGNVVVDILVFALGHELGRRWNASGRARRYVPE